MKSDNCEIIIYQTGDGRTKIEVHMEDETVWLTQAQMAELFQTTKQNISLHINNAFKEGELEPNSVVKEYLTTTAGGKSYSTKGGSLPLAPAPLRGLPLPPLRGRCPRNAPALIAQRTGQFYETSADNQKLSPLVREIVWTNNLTIMSRTKSGEARGKIRLVISHNMQGAGYEF